VRVGHKRAGRTDLRPTGSVLPYGKVAISHVFSVEIGAAHGYSLAARLTCSSAERFRSEVIVRPGGVCEVKITANDVSGELIRAMLTAVRDYLADQDLESAAVRVDGQEYVLSA
jgi:hypothetical protein